MPKHTFCSCEGPSLDVSIFFTSWAESVSSRAQASGAALEVGGVGITWCSEQLSAALRMDLCVDPIRVSVPGPAAGGIVKGGGISAPSVDGGRVEPLLCVDGVTVEVNLQLAGCAHACMWRGAACAEM